MKPYALLGRAALFIAGSVIGGLALAFVIVFIHPQLLLRPGMMTQAPPVRAATVADTADTTAGTASTSRSGAGAAGDVEAIASGAPAAGTPAGDLPADVAPASAGDASPALAGLPDNTGSYAAAVRRAAPAVVNISTRRLVTEQIQPGSFGPLFGDLQPFYRQRMESALGSGVIVDAAGHVVTNNHVIEGADTIMVYLADGRVTSASVVGRDPDTDLALLSIQLKNLPVMPLGRSDMLQVGDPVLAIGDPLGLGQTVTHGIVSATERRSLGVPTFENFIQTDAAINAGNSGGALIDARGELIGINTAVLNKSGDLNVEGIGFAIPVNLVRGVMKEILAHGRVIRGWLGIYPEDIDNEQAHQLGLSRGGVVIANMYRQSPAVAASLRIGDIITAIDGKSVQTSQECLQLIATRTPGSHVTLHLIRGNAGIDADLQVVERPMQSPR
ncbi:MAG TPA: trypsin-like peptidase domain-containing protein [Steroidobacteraceae bacterium]|jgi:serine peptidase DegS|nr:trypsin-like peptidase domain-containing protein [Steroidobacteraceae bacterium]